MHHLRPAFRPSARRTVSFIFQGARAWANRRHLAALFVAVPLQVRLRRLSHSAPAFLDGRHGLGRTASPRAVGTLAAAVNAAGG
jgi:hypothetical protein